MAIHPRTRGRGVTLGLLLAAALAGPARGDVVLWNNGPLVNAPFAGSAGAHDSRVQSELGLSTLAFAGGDSTPSSPFGAGVADDFVVDTPGGWLITGITVYSVPVFAGSESMSDVWMSIWDGPPWMPGSTVVDYFGGFPASASFGLAGVYRVPGSQPLDTSLPVTSGVVTDNLTLPPGHYWLWWEPNPGTLLGFVPRVPPITVSGQITTGDGRVSGTDWTTGFPNTVWSDARDASTNTPQGFPFVIEGRPVAARKGDFDGQRGPDLIFRNVNPQSPDYGRNKLWFMDGVARVSEAFISPDPPGPEWSIVGADDFDTAGAPWNGSDSKTDLVFRNGLTGETAFWLMNGSGRLDAPLPLANAPGLNWRLGATADFNGDARPDLLWRHVTSQKLAIWTMNATVTTGSIIPSPDQAIAPNWEVVAAQDYNDDGATDLLWYNSTSGKLVSWYMDAAVQRISGQFLTPPNAGNNNWKVLAGGDYSRTYVPAGPLNSPDVVWRNQTSGRNVIWHLDFTSTRLLGEFTNPDSNTPPLDWTIVGPR